MFKGEYTKRMWEIENSKNPTVEQMAEWLRYFFDNSIENIVMEFEPNTEKIQQIFKIITTVK